MFIKGVAKDTDVAVFDREGRAGFGMSFSYLSLPAQKNINVDIILQTTGRDGKKRHELPRPLWRRRERAVAALKTLLNRTAEATSPLTRPARSVSIVGAGGVEPPGVADVPEALFNQNINIAMISPVEIKIASSTQADVPTRQKAAIHDAFIN